MDATLPPEESAAARHSQLYRRERRAFRWVCGWLCLLAPVWVGRQVFSFISGRELQRLAAPGDYIKEVDGYFNRIRPWLDGLAIASLVLSIGFLASLAAWILAIRSRRRFERPH